MKKAIVVDKDYGSVTPADLEMLQARLGASGVELKLFHCKTEDEIIACAGQADLIMGTGNPPITEHVLKSLPQLKAVLRFGIGVNSIDLEAATKYGKLVLYMPGFCVSELAVHATALALALERNILYYDSHIRQGEWPKARHHVPRLPRNLTLGLYGFGGSAKEMYRIFRQGFQSRVIACDPYVPLEARKDYDVEFVDEDTLLRESDILSLHIPLTEETRHIINWDAFCKMKSNAAIINVSRGALIDQEALADALEQGEIRFAGLDVFEQEPLPADSRLLQQEDTALTCHSAFYGEESKQCQLSLAYELADAVLCRNEVPARFVANQEILKKLTDYKIM